MDNNQKFIITMDKSIAEKLQDQSLILLSDNNGSYVFMNNGKLNFGAEENKDILTKIAYTNVLCF